MTIQTIKHNVTIYLKDSETTIELTENDALAALEAFKMKQDPIKVPQDECFLYIPYCAISYLKDCPETESEEVTDDTCTNIEPEPEPEP